MAASTTRPVPPDTGSRPGPLDHKVREDWTAGDYDCFENLTRYGDAFAAAHVNRARAVPDRADK